MTAVEFLVNRISVLIPEDIGSQLMFKSNVEKANKMFEQQIIDAFDSGIENYNDCKIFDGEQYYNETYKTN